ncbi:host specificity factor TipJ family phage tail protein [Vibrio cholerae]|uniref:host specificity factor TipJ family phage tail protein n=1 Tax=Vibrio cholerae TaxID=666 RepID=UPI00201A269D|nr:host specificity factor TipJ family phage tail protein [Vibrio cholerae]EJI2331318.1 phage tail protein [Vibrio cholerae]ELK6276008.1 phage tail protein [Vibrio cholerae]MCL5752795.1 host specificity factor TipJ family phage tail protein [Vibrio cholerae]
MSHIVIFQHPVRTDEHKVYSVESGTHLAEWVAKYLPASGALSATCNFEPLPSLDHTIGEMEVISLRPKLGFGPDWLIYAALALSAVSVAASFLMMPDTPGNVDTKQASSVYNYNAQGNKPKLGNPVPVQYGRMPHYPDIAAPNWWEYVGNEQFYYQTFSKGVGEFQFHGHYIGETEIENSPDIELRVYQPGQVVNHFPHIVWTSKEVGGSDGQGGLTLTGVTVDWEATASAQEARFADRAVTLWSQETYRTSKDSTTLSWVRQKWPWKAGQHIIITSTTTPNLIFEGNLIFHDMGDDGSLFDPEEYPDEIENPLGWDFVTVGKRYIFTGAGANSGTYIVSEKLPGNRIRVRADGGGEVTSFEPMSGIFCRISEALDNDGTYVCKDDQGTLARVNSESLEEDPTWFGFIKMDSPTAQLSVLERDTEAKWVGNFVAAPKDAPSLDIGLDFIFPRGLGEMNGDGAIVGRTVEFQVRVRPAGSTSAYQTKTLSFTAADNTPQRITRWLGAEMGLGSGKWEIGCRRISPFVDSTRVFDEVQWMGLKSVIQRDYVNDAETIITLKIRATNALSQQANSQYWCDSTRVLPVLQSDGTLQKQATRSIADAVIDACRDTIYGAGLPMATIDTDTLLAYRTKWAQRGDYCDGLFDSPVAFWDALGRLLSTGRAYPRVDFGTVSLWRDEPRQVLCKPYSPVNMLPESFSADIRLVEDDENDGIEVEFFNPKTRKSETVLCTVGQQQGYNPKKLNMPFITNAEHAWREGLFHAAVLAYRRTDIEFSTDIDGWQSNYGDVVPVAHDAVKWGEFGLVQETLTHEAGQYLQLSGLLTWQPNQQHYVVFNSGNGIHGPYRVAQTEVDDIVLLLDKPTRPIYAVGERGQQPTEYMFGIANQLYKRCILMRVAQKGENEVSCRAVEDDPRVDAYA